MVLQENGEEAVLFRGHICSCTGKGLGPGALESSAAPMRSPQLRSLVDIPDTRNARRMR